MITVRSAIPLAALLLVAACGTDQTPTPAPAAAERGPGADGPGRGNGIPGVNGLIAAVEGSTLQVQGADSQTAVTFSATTVITSTVAATAADVKAGLCVSVRQPASSATPTATVAATSVTISDPVGGACQGPGGFGGRPGGTRPSGAPPTARVRPSGAPGGNRGGFGFGAFGTVKSVSGAQLVIARVQPSGDVTVTTTNTTTYLRTAKAGSSALTVGACVTAIGKADDAGTVAATALSVRPAENGTCTPAGRGQRRDGASD